MDDELHAPHQFAVTAAAFEGSLVVVALVAGWLFDTPPLETLSWSIGDLGWGALATLVPLVGMWLCLRSQLGPLVRLARVVDDLLIPLFRGCGLFELAVISLLAGLGEEMLFRGVVQQALANWIGSPAGVWIALGIAAVLFALAHSITVAYAVLAGLIGLYLGGIWLVSDNLLVPITTHALYDFMVLLYLVRVRAQPE